MRVLLALIAAIAAMGQDVGSKTCSGCHAQIYRGYSGTSMSQSSGKVGAGAFREKLDRASFSDPALGAEYRVSASPEGYRLEFSRADSGVRGQRLLGWFVGSGRVARSYLSSLEGFLFQSPVSYYSLAGKWDISPGYQQHRFVHLTRAVGTGCLQCHASGFQPVPRPPTPLAHPPFPQGGVDCER